jgi:hypothetical protein
LTQDIAVTINLQRNTLLSSSTFDPTNSLPLPAVTIQRIHSRHHLTHFIAVASRCHSMHSFAVIIQRTVVPLPVVATWHTPLPSPFDAPHCRRQPLPLDATSQRTSLSLPAGAT